MDSLTFPANFRLLQLWFSVQLCYYIYAELSTKKNVFDLIFIILYGRRGQRAVDLPVNGFPGQSAGVEINLGGDHDLTPADILFRALPKLMQPTQTLEISISVLPNFVYSVRQRSSFSLSSVSPFTGRHRVFYSVAIFQEAW